MQGRSDYLRSTISHDDEVQCSLLIRLQPLSKTRTGPPCSTRAAHACGKKSARSETRSPASRRQPGSSAAGSSGNDGAGAIACDALDFCGWGGYRTANGKPYAVVRVHHP